MFWAYRETLSVNSRLIHPIVLLLAVMLLAFGAMLPFPAAAHEGEDHGASEPVVVSTATETLIALSGGGSQFDAVLKHRPFAPGETVELALYLVAAETNRPIADAVISASLSQGETSTTVSFTPKPGGPTGAYRAVINPKTAAPMSWLFDVMVGDQLDLIGVTGFQSSPLKADHPAGKIQPQRDWTALPQPAVLVVIGVLLLVVGFVAGRRTLHKGISA